MQFSNNNKTYSLFGDSVTTKFPSRFRDASYTRRVPINQEVFVDSSRDESLVFEVNELTHNVTDLNSAKHFLEELGRKLYSDARMEIKPEDITQNFGLNNTIDQVYVSTAVGTVDIAKRRLGGSEVKNLVKVYLANIRLKNSKYNTDVIITAYEPVFTNKQGNKYGPSGGEMEKIFKDAVSNFEVTDWSFFTEEDD